VGEFVSVQSSGGLATIRLDRPPVNALSIALQGELREAAEQVGADRDIRAVVIYGGQKVFAAGADVKEMASRNHAEMASVSRRLHASFRAVAAIGKPVVAAITGFALGGGLELALCADFRVAGENARFGVPEILLGVIPGLGGTQRLPRLIGPARAKNLIYTGRLVSAGEALRIGLVDHVVPDADVYQAATGIARQFVSGPALALRAAKEAIDTGLDLSLDAGLEVERLHFTALFATQDQKLGMESFVASGPGEAKFTGK
jgi:enoyl-CoA hydratase/carnithine racemase